jgi:hypothetical protein
MTRIVQGRLSNARLDLIHPLTWVSGEVVRTQDGEYGAYRKWGAVGWGAMSLLAGGLIQVGGMGAGLAAHLLLSLPCLALGHDLLEPQAGG